MTGPKFEYNVAFSFHSLDEGLATQLNDLLQDRFKTFLYSKRQEVLAGTDGEETFNRVFGHQAGLVVIFYRQEWGETPFTRIEQTAIRNRAFEDGFDFTLFVPTDGTKALPGWIPKTQLWYGLEQYGMTGAAAVVEARLQELGGEPKAESAADRAARFQRVRAFEEARKAFGRSYQGVNQANKAFEAAMVALGEKVADISSAPAGGLQQLRLTQHGGIWLLRGLGGAMTIDWQRHYANSLEEASLVVRMFDGVPGLPGIMVIDPVKRLGQLRFEYDMLSMDMFGYVETSNRHRTFTEDALAEHLLKFYLDAAESVRRR